MSWFLFVWVWDQQLIPPVPWAIPTSLVARGYHSTLEDTLDAAQNDMQQQAGWWMWPWGFGLPPQTNTPFELENISDFGRNHFGHVCNAVCWNISDVGERVWAPWRPKTYRYNHCSTWFQWTQPSTLVFFFFFRGVLGYLSDVACLNINYGVLYINVQCIYSIIFG